MSNVHNGCGLGEDRGDCRLGGDWGLWRIYSFAGFEVCFRSNFSPSALSGTLTRVSVSLGSNLKQQELLHSQTNSSNSKERRNSKFRTKICNDVSVHVFLANIILFFC